MDFFKVLLGASDRCFEINPPDLAAGHEHWRLDRRDFLWRAVDLHQGGALSVHAMDANPDTN